VHLEFVRDVGRLASGGDEETPAEGSGPAFVTTDPRCTRERPAHRRALAAKTVVGYPHAMRTCQPDEKGRVNLGNLVFEGETWAISAASPDRIELVRIKPQRQTRKASLVDLCQKLGELGFQLPDRDQSPISATAMTVSETDLRRGTSEILDRVKAGESVEIEIHGKPVATIEPSSDGIDAGVLLDALLRLDPDPETADEIQGHIDDMRRARASATESNP